MCVRARARARAGSVPAGDCQPVDLARLDRASNTAAAIGALTGSACRTCVVLAGMACGTSDTLECAVGLRRERCVQPPPTSGAPCCRVHRRGQRCDACRMCAARPRAVTGAAGEAPAGLRNATADGANGTTVPTARPVVEASATANATTALGTARPSAAAAGCDVGAVAADIDDACASARPSPSLFPALCALKMQLSAVGARGSAACADRVRCSDGNPAQGSVDALQCGCNRLQARRRRRQHAARQPPSPGADVAVLSPVRVQIWAG